MKEEQQAVVFCENRLKANWLYDKVKHNTNFDALLHSGDLELADRESALHDSSNSHSKLLFTTDVLSRGVTIPSAHIVVNFDLPFSERRSLDTLEYSSRVTRVGRDSAQYMDLRSYVSEVTSLYGI